jgi:hypothetical protein
MVVGRIVGNGGDIAHGAMSEALWLNVVGCVRIESWVRINRVCLLYRVLSRASLIRFGIWS